MSNVLFALYHDFSANSAVHVHNFANRLADLGHSTAVAIPEDTDTGSTLGLQDYSVLRFDRVDGDWSLLFPDGRPPDIVIGEGGVALGAEPISLRRSEDLAHRIERELGDIALRVGGLHEAAGRVIGKGGLAPGRGRAATSAGGPRP